MTESKYSETEIMRRLHQLELIVDALDIDAQPDQRLLTRKGLSSILSCSERFLQDHPGFKAIEHRLGNKIYYDWTDVKKIIFKKGE